jgi:hypothetical protein
MLRPILLTILLAAANSRTSQQTNSIFAGCYETVSLTSNTSDSTITLIPKQFELLRTNTTPWRGGFPVLSLTNTRERPPFESLWRWKPQSRSQVWIAFNTGFGGFKGTLKKTGNGELRGKLKEWCDGRCGWRLRTATLSIRSIACGLK